MPMWRCEMKNVLGIYRNLDPADDGGGWPPPRGVPLAGLHSQRQTVSYGATREQAPPSQRRTGR
jgi:hypothetical protein